MIVKTAGEAMSLVKHYRCATCWGVLIAHDLDVHCVNENCTGTGFVRKEHVDQRRETDRIDTRDAIENIGKLLGLNVEQPRRTNDEIMNLLGFSENRKD